MVTTVSDSIGCRTSFHVRADEFEDLQRAEVWRELKVIVHVTGLHVPFPALDTPEARFATKCAACIESFCLTYLAGRPVETASRLFDD